MFDVSDWLNDLVEASCKPNHKKGECSVDFDFILPCDNLEQAEDRQAAEELAD